MINKNHASKGKRKSSKARKAKDDFFSKADQRLPGVQLEKRPLRIGKSFASARKKSEAIIRQQFETICNVFKIEEDKYELFKQAVGGGGNEWKEINQLNSSTLLAFLCFQHVSKETPLHIVLGNREVKFTTVSFEQKNQLPKSSRFKKSHPASNMDIILLDENNEFELNLESKFTEYFASQTGFSVANYYGEQYDSLFKHHYNALSSKIRYCHDGGPDYNSCRWETLDGKGHYLEGIKQMISHYLGLLQRKNSVAVNRRRIYLGEILFDFYNDKRPHSQENDEFMDYEKCYYELYKSLSRFSGVTYIGKLLTYQKIFSHPKNISLLTSAVKSFYMLGH